MPLQKTESPGRYGAQYLCNPDGSTYLVHFT